MKTVMVVDDSRIMRNIVKNTFELLKKPVQYLEASDGKQALDILIHNHIDLVLLDWNIPSLSGINFLKKVRAMDNYQDIPIVMVTSEASKLSIIEAVKAGVTAYIIKPFSEKDFVDKLSKIAF